MDGQRTFLRFVGKLWDDMRFEPGLGWETVRISRVPHPDEAFRLELLDEAGMVLVSAAPEVFRGDCRAAHNATRAARVTGYIPFRNDAAAVVLRTESREIHRETLSRTTPSIEIKHVADLGNGRISVAWAAEHERPIRFVVRYLTGRTSYLVSHAVTETEAVVDTASFPGGGAGCRIAVLASDGLRSSFAVSEPFAVDEKPTRVFILSPLNSQMVAADQPFSAFGQAINAFGRSCPDNGLVWDLDGSLIARGTRMVLVPSINPGKHHLALSYVVEGRVLASEAVVIQAAARM
ncbi:hypothetical protein [Arenibaculum pallidiluteum]|uniref:hypothetical protein n=1 Tax=Arenibaculum pallidiluteum TaxID=2812559 RepID=UPI001A960AD7|nr:hypothetical protein [Arenibaculum pallidiluteum]